MPRITAGVPLIVTVDGLKEQLDRPADTETRLYWEMALDHGEAILTPLIELEGQVWHRDQATIEPVFTHRLTSPTGGVFHVRVEEMAEPRQWPQIGPPANLAVVVEMAAEINRMVRQMQTLMAANAELEEKAALLESERDHLKEMLELRPPYRIGEP